MDGRTDGRAFPWARGRLSVAAIVQAGRRREARLLSRGRGGCSVYERRGDSDWQRAAILAALLRRDPRLLFLAALRLLLDLLLEEPAHLLLPTLAFALFISESSLTHDRLYQGRQLICNFGTAVLGCIEAEQKIEKVERRAPVHLLLPASPFALLITSLSPSTKVLKTSSQL